MFSSHMPHARRMVRGIALLFSLAGLGVILWAAGELIFLQKTGQVHGFLAWLEWSGKGAFLLVHGGIVAVGFAFWLVMKKPWYFENQLHVMLSYLWLAFVALGVTLELVWFGNDFQLVIVPAVLCFLAVVKVLHIQRDFGNLFRAS